MCPSGQYGIHCREHCIGKCINSEPCHHVTGVCSNGCQDGFIGKHCNNTCSRGYFGPDCLRECSPNCKPDTCRHTDGSCSSCDAGWTGYNCTTGTICTYFSQLIIIWAAIVNTMKRHVLNFQVLCKMNINNLRFLSPKTLLNKLLTSLLKWCQIE